MKRGRSQVLWRYTPGATFRYNETGGWCRTNTVTLKNGEPLAGALAQAVGQTLARWKAVSPTAYPDPSLQPQKYIVGEPYQVSYSLWPTVFTCRDCGRVHYYKDLARLRQVNDSLGCRSCGGRDRLRQVPYAYVCECGRLDNVYVQKHESNHPIVLKNKGSFQESYWWCNVCRIPLYRNAREGLGYRSCECAPRKGKRGVLLDDSRVYYSQTTALVEIEPQALQRWQTNDRFSDFLLAAALDMPAYTPAHILDLAGWKPTGAELPRELMTMRTVLMENGMPEEEAEALVRKSAKRAAADPWAAYDQDLAPFRSGVGAYAWKDSRQTVEYVFVKDEPSVAPIALDALIEASKKSGLMSTAQRLERERQLAADLGLINLRIVQSLPLLLGAIGYTRYFASPRDASDSADEAATARPVDLRPYTAEEGKIPIYVSRNPTEALFYELDPWRLAAFLEVNAGVALPDEIDAASAVRAWLLSQSTRLVELGESHLVLRPFEQQDGLSVDLPSALLFGLLHSISHVLKATAHQYVGIDADSLAEYLFPAHGAGLLYVSSHVEFTLGGIDSVFRANLTQWLGSARDFAARCSFDPVCARAGGACLACLFPKFGCAHFNRSVSRAYLFGGDVLGHDRRVEGFWTPAVVEAGNRLRDQRAHP